MPAWRKVHTTNRCDILEWQIERRDPFLLKNSRTHGPNNFTLTYLSPASLEQKGAQFHTLKDSSSLSLSLTLFHPPFFMSFGLSTGWGENQKMLQMGREKTRLSDLFKIRWYQNNIPYLKVFFLSLPVKIKSTVWQS